MTSFSMPRKDLLSERARAILPARYSGYSESPILVEVFENIQEGDVPSKSLRKLTSLTENLHLYYESLCESFSSAESDPSDFWMLEIESPYDVEFWFLMHQVFGRISQNGWAVTISETLLEYRVVVGDMYLYIDVAVLKRAASISKYLKDRGSYIPIKDIYLFSHYVSDDYEVMKLLASRITNDDYMDYARLELYTYVEIFKEGVSELPDSWISRLIAAAAEEPS